MSNKEDQEKTIFGKMVEELKDRIGNGEELSDIEDLNHEFVESYLPIYYVDIIDAWKDLPAEYEDRGGDEVLVYGGIYTLMTADLTLYYYDLFAEAVTEVRADLKGGKLYEFYNRK